MIISIEAKKNHFTKFTSFYVKTFNKVDKEGTYLNTIKAIYIANSPELISYSIVKS